MLRPVFRTIRSAMESECDSKRARTIQCNTPNQHFESTAFPQRKRLYHFRITAAIYCFLDRSNKLFILCGELAGARTQDQRLKRALLYQLSYELV